MNEVYVVAATRTPVGKAGRMFSQVRADDLLISAMRGALAQVPHLDPAAIEDVVMGCAMPEGEQGLNLARATAVLAGLPVSVAGMTLNRFCASGLSALQVAADRIRVGEADVMMAGGVESMSRIPMGGFHPSWNPCVHLGENNQSLVLGMGLTAENVAHRWGISRDEQDQFALLSHQRAFKAQAENAFDAEITPVCIEKRMPVKNTAEVRITHMECKQDEGPRRDTSRDALALLKPAFKLKGTVTAGNSSQMSDGAACLILASESALKQFSMTPLARIRSFSVTGLDPAIMGMGPVEAVPKALKRAGVTIDQLDWIELNEAFAAQVLAVQKHLCFNPEKLNPVGGAIALGHPLGASGAIRATTLVHGLKRTGGKFGLVTLCVGMGQGAAALLERVS